MKRIYTWIKAISVMLLVVMLFTACKKTVGTMATFSPTEMFGTQKTFPLYSSGGVNIGSIAFSKEPQGDAKVLISINKSALKTDLFPYQPVLISKTLPSANLQPLNNEGISETLPVISSNKSLVVSYDALMFMRDLKLVITDANNNKIVVADTH